MVKLIQFIFPHSYVPSWLQQTCCTHKAYGLAHNQDAAAHFPTTVFWSNSDQGRKLSSIAGYFTLPLFLARKGNPDMVSSKFLLRNIF